MRMKDNKTDVQISANSRKGTWGTGAIKFISEQLRRELPGLRGFSEERIYKSLADGDRN